MSDPLGWLAEAAAARRAAGLRRSLRPREAAAAGVLDLASNDYLGLSRDPRVLRGAHRALDTWGAGSTGSRLVTGSTRLHSDLEDALADFVGTGAGLVFSSGYLANLGILTALTGPGTLVISDALNHASIVDACRLSRADVVVARHRCVEAVAAALAQRAGRRAVVVTDAVFSVDGDLAPLVALHTVCRVAGALLVIDEAHALGVLGPGGRGAAAAAGLAGEPDVVLTATLSKALGSQGGVLLAHPDVVAHVVDVGRAFIFDTGLAPSCAGAALAALSLVVADPSLPSAVLARAASIADLMGVPRTAGAVVSVPQPSPQEALAAAERALARGVRVGCFRPPSVPDGVSRLRLAARADLADPDLDRLAHALAP